MENCPRSRSRQGCVTATALWHSVLMTESSLLEILLKQQAKFLTDSELPTSLDAIIDAVKRHEAFCISLENSSQRVNATLDIGSNLADREPNYKQRITEICDAINKKYLSNHGKASQIKASLEERQRLCEFYTEVEDLEDWIMDETRCMQDMQTSLRRKNQDISLSQNRIQVIQEEIEVNRGRGDQIIEMGQRLIMVYPNLENDVRSRLERIHVLWDGLAKLIHELLDTLGQEIKEGTLHETLQKTTIWLEETTTQLKSITTTVTTTSLGSVPADDQTPGLTALHEQVKECEKRKMQLDEKETLLTKLQTDLAGRQTGLHLQLSDMKRRLAELRSPLSEHQQSLVRLATASERLLDLRLELAWARGKLDQVQGMINRSSPLSGATRAGDGSLGIGQRLWWLQQAGRQLTSHVAEVNNRRPRMKQLCQNVEKTYLSGSTDRERTFRGLLGEIHQVWSSLDEKMTWLHEFVRSTEAAHQFIFDTNDMEAWILEQQLYLLVTEQPKTEQAALTGLRRHHIRANSISHWAQRMTGLPQRSQTVQEQLLRAHRKAGGDQLTGMDHLNQQIISYVSRVQRAFSSLKEMLAEGESIYQAAISKYRLLREVEDVENWLTERSAVASSYEVGHDLDHCSVLRDRFATFSKQTIPLGTNRIGAITSRCVQLISQGHPEGADIALAKDRVNETWADLLELIETRTKLLNTAWNMHRFVCDCQDTEERISLRLETFPPAPSDDLICGKKQGLRSLERCHVAIEREVTALASHMDRLSVAAKRLEPRYAGVPAEQLQARHGRVLAIWQRLQGLVEQRHAVLEKAMRIHDFLLKAKELIAWLEATHDGMETKERPRDVRGVELLIHEHSILKSEIDNRSKDVEDCLNLGRTLLVETDSTPLSSELQHAAILGPHGEVRERCVQLATGRLLMQELWRERWDRLHLLLEVRQFARDLNSAEMWLAGKELKLMAARRHFGNSVTETLALLGAHEAFEQTLIIANERFDALRRLTTVSRARLFPSGQPASSRPTEANKPPTAGCQSIDSLATARPATSRRTSGLVRAMAIEQRISPEKRVLGTSSKVPAAELPVVASTYEAVGAQVVGGAPNARPTAKMTSAVELRLREPVEPKPIQQASTKGEDEASKAVASPSEASLSNCTSSSTASRSSTSKGSYSSSASIGRREQGIRDSRAGKQPTGETDWQRGSLTVTTAPRQSGTLSPSRETPSGTSRDVPRLEGPAVRKHDIDIGGVQRSRTAGRGWLPLYMVLDGNQLRMYKDYRSRMQKPTESLRHESPIELINARAAAALDYTKRPCVFRLQLNDGREYLFQTANDQVMQRWVTAINASADCARQSGIPPGDCTLTPRLAGSLGISSRLSQSTEAGMARRRSIKTFFSLRRKT